MILNIIFTIGSLAYFVVVGIALRAAYVKGHRGDFTMPISILFLGITIALWAASLVLLRSMDFSALAIAARP